MAWAIYFDTNALIPSSDDLFPSPLLEVVAQAREWNTPLCIPQLVVDELLQHELRQFKEMIQEARRSTAYFKALTDNDAVAFDREKVKAALPRVEERLSQRLAKANVVIVPTPELDLSVLIDQAVRREPPFQAGDKGFRDAIILETVAEHAIATVGEPRVILLISADKGFAAGGKRLVTRGIQPVFASPKEAAATFSESRGEAVGEILRRRSETAMAFLIRHEQQVFEFVRKGRVRIDTLEHPNLFEKDPALVNARILEVKHVRPLRISSARPGLWFGDPEKPADRYPFNFEVDVSFDLLIARYNMRRFFSGPTVALEGATDLRNAPPFDDSIPAEVHDEITIQREVLVDATVALEGAEEENYQDLKLERVRS